MRSTLINVVAVGLREPLLDSIIVRAVCEVPLWNIFNRVSLTFFSIVPMTTNL